MGCDIYCFIEVKRDNEWLYLGRTFNIRDYKFFGLLAGVRDKSVMPISEPKGLPIDSSIYLNNNIYADDLDAHSESYLSLNELTKNKLKKNNLYKSVIKRDYKYLEKLSKMFGKDNVRIVFWFNN